MLYFQVLTHISKFFLRVNQVALVDLEHPLLSEENIPRAFLFHA